MGQVVSGRGFSDPERCHEALRQVLESHTFARSEQSRNFLKYVCEKTILGQTADIKEYLIGVEALGRPRDYSPADDSSVRRRAYEIRQRLEEFYGLEMPEARLRIELPKGCYVPVFAEWEPPPANQPASVDQSGAPVPAASSGRRRMLLVLAAGALAGAGIMAGVRAWFPPRGSAMDPVLREVWGPLLAPGSRTLICLGSTLYMMVRASPFPDRTSPSYPVPNELYDRYGETRPLPSGAKLFMRPADNVAPIGVISGVAVATATMRLAGAGYQILPERTAPLPSFRGRNVLLFGDALTSHAAAKELRRAYLTIAYDDSGTALVIRDRRKPRSAPPVFSRKMDPSTGTLEVYGLITVLPTEGSSSAHERTFVISGVSNAGIHGAMEFLASPERLRSLQHRLQGQGFTTLPSAYQVVVRCTAARTLLLSYDYTAHEVIDPGLAASLR